VSISVGNTIPRHRPATTEDGITAEVLRRIEATPDPRLREIMLALVRHLHAFVKEVGLTEAEWFQGVQFLTDTSDEDLDKVLTFATMTAGTVTANKHKIAANIFLHEIRHWAQIATVLRQNGFVDQWPHDMLLSSIKL